MNILELITSQLGGNTVSEMSRHLGAEPEKTNSALSAALPLIVGALARNSKSEEGASALAGALERDHDGGIFDNITDLFSNPDNGQGNGILKHVLGGKREVAEQAISQKSGLDLGQTAKMLTMVAPLLMGALGKKKREENIGAGALAGMLQQTSQQVEQPEETGGGGGFITNLLDRDGDGNVMDDIGGMLGGLFGR